MKKQAYNTEPGRDERPTSNAQRPTSNKIKKLKTKTKKRKINVELLFLFCRFDTRNENLN
jgi:hypothetical protein